MNYASATSVGINENYELLDLVFISHTHFANERCQGILHLRNLTTFYI